jgi:hypothetical protein
VPGASHSPSSPRPPADTGLPGADALLDVGRVRELLAPAAPGRALSDAEVRYLELDPGRSLLVLWRLRVDGAPAQVVLSRGRMRAGRDGSRTPGLAEIGDPPVLVAWYPADPGLPLLRAGLEAVARGLMLPAPEPRLLAWMPQQRATLRLGDAVVKLYAERRDAESAMRAHVACADWLHTPAPLGADLDARVTAQRAVSGRPLGRADAVAAARRAGGAIRRLHDAPLSGLRPDSPATLLESCRAAGARVTIAAPCLEARVARAGDLLEASMPPGLAHVPSHGDFTVGQMIEDEGDLWIADTDTLCAAPAAHDLAAYAANLVSGRAVDAADAQRALREIVEGYGATPPALEWYLAAAVMRRLDRPLRRLKRRWPQRTERILTVVEDLVSR